MWWFTGKCHSTLGVDLDSISVYFQAVVCAFFSHLKKKKRSKNGNGRCFACEELELHPRWGKGGDSLWVLCYNINKKKDICVHIHLHGLTQWTMSSKFRNSEGIKKKVHFSFRCKVRHAGNWKYFLKEEVRSYFSYHVRVAVVAWKGTGRLCSFFHSAEYVVYI